MIPAVWFDDIFLCGSKELGFVVGQNVGPIPNEETYNVVVSFKPNQDAELQLIDTYDGELNNFVIPKDAIYAAFAELIARLKNSALPIDLIV